MQGFMQDIKCIYLRDSLSIYGEKGLSYASQSAAGMDLRSMLEEVTISPAEKVLIPSGISLAIPEGFMGAIYSRSGLGIKFGIVVTQGVGVIDSDYRGEIMVSLCNTSNKAHTISKGERIAQIVFQPFLQAKIIAQDTLPETERGNGGFGHTGSF